MELHWFDITIIIVYLIGVILIGFWLRKRASEDIASYFLGSREVPWYVLGVSNASSMFDITGTMWLVYVIFVYGLKGAWLPWLWPTFNQVFLMIFLAVWIRRSNVITGAEWITTRFGAGRGGELSRISVVIFALVSVVGFMTYVYQGIGRFAAVFLPWDWAPSTYSIILMAITTIYVILGGMYSVVLTDVIQFVMLAIGSVVVGWIAITKISPADIAAVTPDGWKDLFFGWTLQLDWGNLIPEVNDRIVQDGYNLFTIIMMMILFKGILVSLAGPAPNYDMQRVLATRKPKESAMMSGMVSVALFPRWLLITGATVLGLVFYSPQLRAMGENLDLEMVFPYVINNFIPVGVVGIMIAGLLAAYMSTFDSTVNAGAAYLVNDIYARYIKPGASSRQNMLMSYLASIGIVLAGILFGSMARSINDVMQWIVSGLYGGYTAPNILKWYWWRFNGYGYFWGMIAGVAASLLFPTLFPDMLPLYGFPFILLLSGAACVIGSLMTPPDKEEVLKSFYKSVRPWGFWGHVHRLVKREDPDFQRNTSFGRDMLNVAVGIIWQLSIVIIPIYLIIQSFREFWISVAILLVTSVFLKKNWYDKLEEY